MKIETQVCPLYDRLKSALGRYTCNIDVSFYSSLNKVEIGMCI